MAAPVDALRNIADGEQPKPAAILPTPPEPQKQQQPARKVDTARLQKAEAAIAVNEWDTNAWQALYSEARYCDIAAARNIYERFFTQFKTAGRHWVGYAEHEYSLGNLKEVESIFMRSLVQCPNIDLWRFYLRYVLETKGQLADGREQITQSYEFALEHMGLDVNSLQIWQDYVNFLKTLPAETPQEEGLRMTAMRRVYQRSVQVPMHGVDTLWKEYDAFENERNKVLAAAFIRELSPRYNAARTAYRGRRPFLDGIERTALARPPPPSSKEMKQIEIWRSLLKFELTNPQKLDDDVLHRRIVFTFKQSLLVLWHYPDLWHEYLEYLISMYLLVCVMCVGVGMVEEIENAINIALVTLPNNLLLHYIAAEWEESRQNFDKSVALYEKVLSKKEDPLTYIQLMRATRRSQGTEPARKVFVRAMKSSACTYHIYVACALIEFFVNRDAKVARYVFELGLKKYVANPAFVIQYVTFLEHLNDTNNLRVVYQRILAAMPPSASADVWKRYMMFEYSCGDLETQSSADKRYREAIGASDRGCGVTYINASRRYRFLDLSPITDDAILHALSGLGSEIVVTDGKPVKEKVKERRRKKDKGNDDIPPQVVGLDPSRFSVPDIRALNPFNPESQTSGGLNVAGLSVRLPDIFYIMASRLPPSSSFYSAPMPNIAAIIDAIREAPLPVSGQQAVREGEDSGGDLFTRRQRQKIA